MKIKQAVARMVKKQKEKEVWQESTAVVYRILINEFQRIVHTTSDRYELLLFSC